MDISAHPWFSEIDMEALKKREIKAPYIPVEDDFHLNFNTEFSDS